MRGIWGVWVGAIVAVSAGGARAASFTTDDGWRINLDTTVSAGVSLRASARNHNTIGGVNGGGALLPNADDGNLNFAPGSITSAPLRITEEVAIKGDGMGAFVRATGFWDPVYDGTWARDFRPVTRPTARRLGADLRLLDAYVFADAHIGGRTIAARLGNQVLNWGESTFLTGGINSFTPFDATALEAPGSELREAVLPVPAIDLRGNITDNISVEGFYQALWVRTRFEPLGSFLSINDNVSDGARYAVIDPTAPDNLGSLNRIYIPSNNIFGALIPRVVDRHPSDQGEFGVAARYLAPFLNDAELGLYFENFHSRTPFVSYRTGTAAAAANALPVLAGLGGTPYNATASLRADYPSDIRLLGASFSTTVFGGIGLQGELSHRFNQPLLLSGADAIGVVEQPFLCHFAQQLQTLGLAALANQVQTSCVATGQTAAGQALGHPGFSQTIAGYKRFGVSQAQITATSLAGGIDTLGITNTTLIGEIGMNVIHDFPNSSALLDSGFDNLGTSRNKIIAATTGAGNPHPTEFASGLVVAALFDLPQVLPKDIDFQPSIAFSTGIFGRDAVGEGPFQQGQAAINIGATFSWLENFKLKLGYVNRFGFGPTTNYGLQDRDFASAAVSYTF